MEVQTSSASTLKVATLSAYALYQRMLSSVETAWVTPLFGGTPEGTICFEEALKVPEYLPEHPSTKFEAAADPTSVISGLDGSSSASDTQPSAPDTPRAMPSESATPSKSLFSLPLSLPELPQLFPAPATPQVEEQAGPPAPAAAQATGDDRHPVRGLRRVMVVFAAVLLAGALGARRAKHGKAQRGRRA